MARYKLKAKENHLFCPLVWTHSFVNINGQYQVCCTSESFDNAILDEKGEPFNIKNKPDLNAIYNSDFMKKLRLQLMDGEWPALCSRCRITEEQGGHSRRNIENLRFKDKLDEMIEQTQDDGESNYPVLLMDYRLGNLCNTQCRMCNPYASNQWIEDFNQVALNASLTLSEASKAKYRSYNWSDDSYLIEEFEQKIKHVSFLHFAGGEPLVVPKLVDLLECCVKNDVAKNITLSFNTNLTKLPKKVLELWKEFKAISLLVSIDGVGKLNDYIRPPSKFEIIENNLRFLDQFHQDYNISEIIVSTTVQAYNIGRLTELQNYLESYQFVTKVPNFVNLYYPKYLRTQVLPPKYKMQVEKELLKLKASCAGKVREGNEYLIENIDQVINFMNDKNDEIGYLNFLKFTHRAYKYFEQQLKEVIPELSNAK